MRPTAEGPEVTIALSERLLRQKSSGAWPEKALRKLETLFDPSVLSVAENRDVMTPWMKENFLQTRFPFFEYLEKQGMGSYVRRGERGPAFVSHHLCHASAAALMSPFEKAVIVVLDGAGTASADFPEGHAESALLPARPAHEEASVYLLDRVDGRMSLRCVDKRWRNFMESSSHHGRTWSEGIGLFYESIAEFVFRCKQSSGKVMGLAPLGNPGRSIRERAEFLEGLDWSRAFDGSGKKNWEKSPDLSLWADLAAIAQESFEEDYFAWLESVREKFPDYGNLILTGGCALNCTANGKLARRGLFDEVYVPPFPGDESIGLGAAAHLYFQEEKHPWTPFAHERQHGYFGPADSSPTPARVREVFRDFEIESPASITDHASSILADGNVIAWFQGRSESGPRSLGHRSILARTDRPGLKDHLNAHIKFREAFRPYGASVPHSKAYEYFDVPRGFNTPYMAFASPVRAEARERLREVTHVDGTCRYQSVRPGQCGIFHELLMKTGEKTGLYCLLNTSLNVMGEPIIETLEEARTFLLATPVHGLAVGDFYVRRPR